MARAKLNTDPAPIKFNAYQNMLRHNLRHGTAKDVGASNQAVSDSLTKSRRVAQNKRTIGTRGCVKITTDANMRASYNDAGNMIDDVTGASLDPVSAYTRPQIYKPSAEVFEALQDRVAMAKMAKRAVLYCRFSPATGVEVCGANGADFIITKREGSKAAYVVYRILRDATYAIVVKKEKRT